MLVNHKRVARIMGEDNLLAVPPRQFGVTTDSDHELEVYLNLASRMKLTGIDQLWVADITYIRLKTEFVYLAVILDGFSRKGGATVPQAISIRLSRRIWFFRIGKPQPSNTIGDSATCIAFSPATSLILSARTSKRGICSSSLTGDYTSNPRAQFKIM
jgi:hypothetical protein